MAENGDKNELITKEIWFSEVNDEKLFFWKSFADEQLSRAILGIKLDLAVPTYQKYVNTLSHDSRDIKNVQNKLKTKKIQAFEIRRI